MIERLYHSLLSSLERFRSLAYWAAFVAAIAETALVVGLLVLLGALIVPGFAAETSGDSHRDDHSLDPIAVPSLA